MSAVPGEFPTFGPTGVAGPLGCVAWVVGDTVWVTVAVGGGVRVGVGVLARVLVAVGLTVTGGFGVTEGLGVVDGGTGVDVVMVATAVGSSCWGRGMSGKSGQGMPPGSAKEFGTVGSSASAVDASMADAIAPPMAALRMMVRDGFTMVRFLLLARHAVFVAPRGVLGTLYCGQLSESRSTREVLGNCQAPEFPAGEGLRYSCTRAKSPLWSGGTFLD